MARAPARLTLALAALLAGAPATAAIVPAERPTTEQKRCAAAERRVARHRDSLREIDARLARQREVRAACDARRACERADREIRSEEARHARTERQLAQYEAEARAICARVR